jgi:hypothetical protein
MTPRQAALIAALGGFGVGLLVFWLVVVLVVR